MDPFRLQVLVALTTALTQITPTNGFQHDLTDSVYRGRLLLTEKEGLPALAINEPPSFPEEIESPNGSQKGMTVLPLLIQGFIQDDLDNPTDPAYRLLADVQMRLSQERTRGDGFDILGFGQRIHAMDIGQSVVRPPDAVVSDNSFFWLKLTVTFAENFQNPFA